MDSIDREALEAAGLDPDDPAEWVTQWRIRSLLRWRAQQGPIIRPAEPYRRGRA